MGPTFGPGACQTSTMSRMLGHSLRVRAVLLTGTARYSVWRRFPWSGDGWNSNWPRLWKHSGRNCPQQFTQRPAPTSIFRWRECRSSWPSLPNGRWTLQGAGRRRGRGGKTTGEPTASGACAHTATTPAGARRPVRQPGTERVRCLRQRGEPQPSPDRPILCSKHPQLDHIVEPATQDRPAASRFHSFMPRSGRRTNPGASARCPAYSGAVRASESARRIRTSARPRRACFAATRCKPASPRRKC